MEAWKWLWTILWYAGIGVFSVLTVVIAIEGGKDLRALLKALREEADELSK